MSVRLVWDATPATLVQTAVFAVLTAVLPAGMVWLGKRLVDLAVEGAARSDPATGALTVAVLCLGLGAAVLKTLSAIQSRRVAYFASVVELHAEQRLLRQIATTDYAYYDRPDWYDRAARAMRDLNWRPYGVAQNVIGLGGSVLAVAAMVALLCTLSPALAALGVAAVLPSAVVGRWANARWYDFWSTTTTDERQRHYLRDVLSAPEAAKEIRAFGLAEHLSDRHLDVSTRRLLAMRDVSRSSEKWSVLAGVASGIAFAAAYGLVASRAARGEVTPGELTIVIGAFAAATAQAGGVLSSLFDLDQSATFLDDYFSFLEVPPLLPVAVPTTALPAKLAGGLVFESVSFSYPTQSDPAVRDVTLHVGPGELLALVGANGAGKTTLAKLMLRLYDPSAGRITLGGVDVRETDPTALRARFGVLFQDFFRYDLTVRDNLAMGRVDRPCSDDEIATALVAADAAAIVAELPLGLDSHIGKRFEDGHDLSGGEWQRLALARLFLRDADVWVLDEPVSALDPEAEAALVERLRDQLQDRIGIVISHRMSTVRIATRIAVLEGGTVVELGTHDELVRAGGRYAHMFELQASQYR